MKMLLIASPSGRSAIDGLAFEGFIADKAFDSNSILADLNERGAKIVISQHPRRTSPLPIDADITSGAT